MPTPLRRATLAAVGVLVLGFAGRSGATPVQPAAARPVLLQLVEQLYAAKLRQTAAQTAPGYFPVESPVGATRWLTAGSWHWAAGFVPAELWLMYQATGDPSWQQLAVRLDSTLPREATDVHTHDLGFMLESPYLPAYESTGDARYADLLRRAAATLDRRWRPRVGALFSWPGPPGQVLTIVDSSMNMDLLFWAAAHGAGQVLARHALAHLRTVARDGQRPDGSTVHVLDYSAATGRLLRTYTAQGFSDTSTWARGQAWFLTGMAEGYEHTGDPVLLAAASAAANYYLAHLPTDYVPYWDLSAPAGSATPRDTSAGAVAAFGLGVLARVTPDPVAAARWRTAGRTATLALLRPPYVAPADHPAVLAHAAHGEKGVAMQADTSFPYGDYYLLRALLALADQP